MNINKLIGKTLTKINGAVGDASIEFILSNGTCYKMFHYDDCCESVSIEDICGDLADLIGSPIINAEESTSDNVWPDGIKKKDYEVESYTWTFYKISTIKGSVVIRWYGESNGYYSESVSFEEVKK